jgi:pimeloyl-ACP methyl ester carboxylesterase
MEVVVMRQYFYKGNWIESFPDHHQWSNATLVTKGMAPWGAVALAEIDEIIQKLHQRQNEPNAWAEEWTAVAERLEKKADQAAVESRDATAGNYYIRAGNYFYTGERMVPPGEEKSNLYDKALRCYQEGLRRRHRNIEFVDVPYEGIGLPAYFMQSPHAVGAAPTVVLFDGLDNCKEMSVLFAGLELAFRGFHVLAVDGPGQGEALRIRNIHSRYDSEVAGTAAYNFIAQRAEVDPDRVAVMAYSAGGYHAPRMAAFEDRYRALVAWGAHYDYHEVWQLRWEVMKANERDQATSHFQLPWVLGEPDMDSAMKKLEKFTLEGVAPMIKSDRLRMGLQISSAFVIHDVDVDTTDARPHGRDRAEDEALSDRSHRRGMVRIEPLLPRLPSAGASLRLICGKC